jgi:hypothetical protein
VDLIRDLVVLGADLDWYNESLGRLKNKIEEEVMER